MTPNIKCIWIGGACAALGANVIIGWLMVNESMVRILPNSVVTDFNTGLLLLLSGCALAFNSDSLGQKTFRNALAAIVVTAASTILMEHAFDIDLLIDNRIMHQKIRDDGPLPGRTAATSCAAFILIGLIILLLEYAMNATRATVMWIANCIVTCIAVASMAGHLLSLDVLYQGTSSIRMSLAAATGIAAVSLGLWIRLYNTEWFRQKADSDAGKRITNTGTVLLLIMGVTAGLLGFAAFQMQFQASFSLQLSNVLASRAELIETTLEEALEQAKSIASIPSTLQYMEQYGKNVDQAVALAELRESASNFSQKGLASIAFHDSTGKEIVAVGPPPLAYSRRVALSAAQPSQLLWDRGFVLRTEVPIENSSRKLGAVVVERRLDKLTKSFENLQEHGVGGDNALCGPLRGSSGSKRPNQICAHLCGKLPDTRVMCFPNSAASTILVLEPEQRRLRLPIDDALAGRIGVRPESAHRQDRISAYRPIKNYQLGIVLKMDTEELYAPIKKQLELVLALLFILVAVGTIVLQRQIRPLVLRLVKSEHAALVNAHVSQESAMRLSAVVDHVNDGILTMNQDGNILSINLAGCHIFGCEEREIVGQHFTRLIPDRLHRTATRYLARYRALPGHDRKKSSMVAMLGKHSSGREMHLELGTNQVSLHGEIVYVGIVHDVTETQLATKALAKSEERLRVTLHSIGDAVISTEMNGKISYMNPVAEELTGWSNEEAVGRQLDEVYNIVHEKTREKAPDPVRYVAANNQGGGTSAGIVLISRNGTEYAIDDSASPIRNQDGRIIGVVIVFHNVTVARQMAVQISYQASHDALTDLINRREFEHRLAMTIENDTDANHQHSLLYIDLDQFKIVNDTCGHVAGDELLRQISTLLKLCVRETDTLARLGGDEFAVLLYHCKEDAAMQLADQLRQNVADFRFVWKDKSFSIGASIGLVCFGKDMMTLSDVLSAADSACYIAKEKGRNRIHAYYAGDIELMKRFGEMDWVGRINKALLEDRFRLYAQVIVPLKSDGHGVRHYELLIRMIDEKGDLTPPMAFIPSAERYNLMAVIDRWVVKNAFSYMAMNSPDDHLQFSVNLSGASVSDEKFSNFIIEQFEHYQIPCDRICFEITETTAIANLTQASRFIRELKARGCKFSLDDFGSGMSSFTYLKHLPVDFLKIDGSFVKDMINDPIDHAMVEAINNIGQVMGIRTVAEAVENDMIRDRLQQIGVDFVQGFGVGMPEPIEDIIGLRAGCVDEEFASS